ANNSSQLNLDAEVSRANLAEFIEDYIISENYIMDEFEKEDNEDYRKFVKGLKKNIHDKHEDELGIKIFDGRPKRKDEDYLKWIKENPNGFILNLERRGSYCMIHKSKCDSISEFSQNDKRRERGETPTYTQNDKIKIVSCDSSKLEKYYFEYHVYNTRTVLKCTRKQCDGKFT
ncbi:MAG: hypothetical protein ACPGVB_17450, partial [Chitinophagales bacterium]